MANLTLLEIAKRTDPNGDAAKIANILAQTNEILLDMQMVKGNLPTGHQTTITTGLPTIYYRSINEGIPTSKATTAQVTEGISIAEAMSEVDVEAIKLNGNEAAYRMGEAEHFLEAMNQKQATGLFYGNPQNDPDEFLGLTQRYSSLSAGNAQNIIDSGGTTANQLTSIWLVGWGEKSVYGIYPDGSTAGLERIDHGEGIAYEFGGTGKRLRVKSESFVWKLGLVVHNWQGAVRIANIDTTDFAGLIGDQDPTTFVHVIHRMITAHGRVPRMIKARAKLCWYVNASVHTVLMRLAMEKSAPAALIMTSTEQFGRTENMLTFLGAPIRQCDAILNTESQVIA